MVGVSVLTLLLFMGGWVFLWSQSEQTFEVPEQDFHRFAGVSGPRHVTVSYTHLRAHETVLDLVCRLLLEKKKKHQKKKKKHYQVSAKYNYK